MNVTLVDLRMLSTFEIAGSIIIDLASYHRSECSQEILIAQKIDIHSKALSLGYWLQFELFKNLDFWLRYCEF